jgi:hypothetical protein
LFVVVVVVVFVVVVVDVAAVVVIFGGSDCELIALWLRIWERGGSLDVYNVVLLLVLFRVLVVGWGLNLIVINDKVINRQHSSFHAGALN